MTTYDMHDDVIEGKHIVSRLKSSLQAIQQFPRNGNNITIPKGTLLYHATPAKKQLFAFPPHKGSYFAISLTDAISVAFNHYKVAILRKVNPPTKWFVFSFVLTHDIIAVYKPINLGYLEPICKGDPSHNHFAFFLMETDPRLIHLAYSVGMVEMCLHDTNLLQLSQTHLVDVGKKGSPSNVFNKFDNLYESTDVDIDIFKFIHDHQDQVHFEDYIVAQKQKYKLSYSEADFLSIESPASPSHERAKKKHKR
jgi:hypothetical protein